MPRPPIDLHQKAKEVLEHHTPLPADSIRPLAHFERTSNDSSALLRYVHRHLEAGSIYRAVYDRHMALMNRMILVSYIESFERFLKELAALCIDHLVNHIADDRFEKFEASGAQIAAHFAAKTFGKAVCESDTWLTNRTINERFRNLLKAPFGESWENLFPDINQLPKQEQDNARTLAIVWQVRHTITHNVGLITPSDAVKFRLLLKGQVASDRVLAPTEDDLRYVKRFLSELAHNTNSRVGRRLADVLTQVHADNPSLFDSQQEADRLSRELGHSITVDKATGKP